MTFKRRRLSFKYVEAEVAEYNRANGTLYAIQPSYEYYQLVELQAPPKTGIVRQLKRGTLRECYDALP